MELTLVDVDHLFTCLHQLHYLHHCPQLFLLYLSLLVHLATVDILWLDIAYLVPLVQICQSLVSDLDTELLLDKYDPLMQ